MTQGAFYQQKRTSPTAFAVVVLMHGAALTALALAKGEVFTRDKPPPTTVDLIEEQKPPPEVPPEPVRTETPPPPSVITHTPPLVPMPPRPELAQSEPLPPTPAPSPLPPTPAPAARMEPPAPAPAPPAAKTVEPARAKANLSSYVSDADYPSNAVRNEEQGTTRFRLTVGPDGKVTQCTVTGSSGSSALDSTTCRLMKHRAKFTPARNNRGEPTSDTVAGGIRWVLPAD
jgi:protein TonB